MANRTDWSALMAASLMSILPITVIYYFAQRHLIGGHSFGRPERLSIYARRRLPLISIYQVRRTGEYQPVLHPRRNGGE